MIALERLHALLGQRSRLLGPLPAASVLVAATPGEEAGIEPLVPWQKPGASGAPWAVLAPAHDALLEKRLLLPRAARAHLESAIELALERETPFERDEVAWGYEVVEDADPLIVDLLLVPLARLQPLVDASHAANLRVAGVLVDRDGGPRMLAWREAAAARPLDRRDRALIGAGAALVLASLLALPLVETVAASRAEGRLAALEARLAAEVANEPGLLARLELREHVARRQREAGDPLGALATLAQRLPDGAYLTRFDHGQRGTAVAGVAADAEFVADALAQAPELPAIRLTAPVVPADAGGESFAMQAPPPEEVR